MLASGLRLIDKVPQGHKLARVDLVDLAVGDAVRRYNVIIGRASRDIPAGSGVHERLLDMPAARSLAGLPAPGDGHTVLPAPLPALGGHTFVGDRNADGSVGTRNILAITTTVQCVAGVVEFAVARIRAELLPAYSNVDDVVGLTNGDWRLNDANCLTFSLNGILPVSKTCAPPKPASRAAR